jgi:hypothetical protein
LLLDEMHSPSVASALTIDGWDVVAVAADSSLRGIADGELLAAATAQQRSLVTENIVDFAIIARQWAVERRVQAGLIFTSPVRFNRASRAYPGALISALRDVLAAPPAALADSGEWWL